MHVTIEHVFTGIRPGAYEALYFDEAFNESLGRHLRYEPVQAANSEAKQVFGTSRASFLEELDYDVRTRRGAWRTIPNMFPERLKNTGTIAFLDDAAGTKRTVEGDAIVKLFGFGGRVEKIIIAEIVKN